MNSAVARTWFLYCLCLLLACLLNIDSVTSWYENKCEGREDISRWLAAGKHVPMTGSVSQWLDQFECASGFLFEGSYKDKSKCEDDSGRLPPLGANGTYPPIQARVPASAQPETDRVISGKAHAPEQVASPASAREVVSVDNGTAGRSLANMERSTTRLSVPEAAAATRPLPPPPNETPAAPAMEEPAALPENPPPPDGETSSEGPVSVAALLSTGSAGKADPEGRNPGGAFTRPETRSVLLVGDSLAYGLAISLGNDIKQREGTVFSCFTKVSSGLNNPNVLNWEKTIQILIRKTPPQEILIMMGVNDANNHIREGNRIFLVGTPEWTEAYERKVYNFLCLASEVNARLYWIGVPVVREEWLQRRVEQANQAARERMCKAGQLCLPRHPQRSL